MSYVKLILTTKQKPRADAEKIKKGEIDHTTMKNHQFTKVGRNRRRKKQLKYKITRNQLIRWH